MTSVSSVRDAAADHPTAEATIMSGKTRVLGGITVSDTPLITRAMEFAQIHSEPVLFNHAVRSWLFAVRPGQLQGIAHDAEVVAVGSLLHDLGLTEHFTGHKRFEVDGADAARTFAREQGLDDRRVQLVWDTVALNSTPSIPLYKEAEVALYGALPAFRSKAAQPTTQRTHHEDRDYRRKPAHWVEARPQTP